MLLHTLNAWPSLLIRPKALPHPPVTPASTSNTLRRFNCPYPEYVKLGSSSHEIDGQLVSSCFMAKPFMPKIPLNLHSLSLINRYLFNKNIHRFLRQLLQVRMMNNLFNINVCYNCCIENHFLSACRGTVFCFLFSVFSSFPSKSL